MKYSLIQLLFILSFICQSCTYRRAFTGTAWPLYPDIKTHVDQSQLSSITNFIKDSSRTTGLMAAINGKVFYQYGEVDKISYIASCRKSVLSMLYGKFVENGQIDLSQTIGELGIEEKDGLLPIEKRATIHDILSSRSGVFHEASNGGYDKEHFLERGSVAPGTYFVYSNWDFNVAGHIFEQLSGKTIYESMEEQLAIPLGFQDWHLDNQKKRGNKKKSQYLAYHMYLSTRDMAKIGQLMLNNGYWEGQQLISTTWISKMTSPITSRDTVMSRAEEHHIKTPAYAYGYMWWLFDEYKGNSIYEGSYTAIGYGGQYITIIPKLKMVIAHKTRLNLPTLVGLTYQATEESIYFSMVDKLVTLSNDL